MRPPRSPLKLLAVGTAIFFIAATIYYLVSWGSYALSWRQRTSPLPIETVSHLCSTMDTVPQELCNEENEVYVLDFVEPIESFLLPENEKPMTFDRVALLLGDYEAGGCSIYDQTEDQPGYKLCRYDLLGDGMNQIFVVFDLEDNVTSVRGHSDF